MANDQDEPTPGSRKDAEPGEASPSLKSEVVRKLVTAGLTAAFMTEESVRSFVSEMKLPKESLNLLLQGATKSKEELMNRIGKEVVSIISKIDFVKEASRFVEEHKFKISAEVEVTKKNPPEGAPKS